VTLTCVEGGDAYARLDLGVNARIMLEKPAMRGPCLFTEAQAVQCAPRPYAQDQSARLLRELNTYCARPIYILGREYH
jgi:hypothetical protein